MTRQPRETPEQLPSAKRRARRKATAEPTEEIPAPAVSESPPVISEPQPVVSEPPTTQETRVQSDDALDEIPIDTEFEPSPSEPREPPEDKPRKPAVGPIPELDAPPLRKDRWRLIAALIAVVAVALFVIMISGRGDRDAGNDSLPAAVADAGTPALRRDAHAAATDTTGVLRDAAVARAVLSDAASDATTGSTDSTPLGDGGTKTYREYYEEAKRARNRKDWDKAIEMIDLTIATHRSAKYMVYKADILLEKGDFTAAMDAISQAIKTSSRYGRAWMLKGELHMVQGQNAEAIKAYQRFLELEPNHDEAASVRAILKDLK